MADIEHSTTSHILEEKGEAISVISSDEEFAQIDLLRQYKDETAKRKRTEMVTDDVKNRMFVNFFVNKLLKDPKLHQLGITSEDTSEAFELQDDSKVYKNFKGSLKKQIAESSRVKQPEIDNEINKEPHWVVFTQDGQCLGQPG